METIDTFKPVYQAFLESNLTVRDFCKQIGLLYEVERKADDEQMSY